MDQVTIDVGAPARGQATVGVAAAGLFCALAACAVGGELARGRTGGVVIGSIFLVGSGALLLVLLFGRERLSRLRLVLDPSGVRWQDTGGRAWFVAWPELAGVWVSRTVRDGVHSAAARRLATVRLDLLPLSEADFRPRHPGLAARAQPDGVYRQPLGLLPEAVPLVEQAVLRYAPAIWRGVHDGPGLPRPSGDQPGPGIEIP